MLYYEERIILEFFENLKCFLEKNTRSLREPFKQIHINYVELCLTTKCTLKCKKCWHLMPYYLFHPQGMAKAGDFSLNTISKTINKFLQAVDTVENFCLLGGEPFIYKDLDRVVKILDNTHKVKKIGIITNGTVIPSNTSIEAMKSPKVYVEISDYGNLSTHLKEVEKILRENNIPYKIRNCYNDLWVDPGDIQNQELSNTQLIQQYSQCTVPLCQFILGGKFYMCPRCAHMINLGLIPDDNSEYVALLQNNRNKNKKEIKKLFKRKYLTSCNYCNSIMSNKRIEAAIQFSPEEIAQMKEAEKVKRAT